ncbi:hypothetical protein [Rhizobium sp. 18055]|uniref:hypothetical protein n=1 Tax=Rhizobium sp. 18055 TaxID=2681403 RepID=UPI001AED367D|nr:hypothetical protein [Rhizobium sp. 18055]
MKHAGEIEGKLIVLESIALVCVEDTLAHRNANAIAKLRENIERMVRERCHPLKLAPDDEVAAQQYALEFFDAVVDEVFRRRSQRPVRDLDP